MSVRDWHAEHGGYRVVSTDLSGEPTSWIYERFDGDLTMGRSILLTHPYPETVEAAKATMPVNVAFRIEYQPGRSGWIGHIWSPTGVFPGIPLTPVRAHDEIELRYLMSRRAIEMGAT